MIPVNTVSPQPPKPITPQTIPMGKILVGQMLKKRQQKQFTPTLKPTLTPTQILPTKPFEQKHPNLI